jgi:ATP-dependent RNA helicase DeaD
VTFAEMPIHPALAFALSARGYETPTGVQAAVLDAGCSGRDLLVSSHTGSGKTVAFGAAMADSLLAPAETHVPHGPNPIALVIVPTRELAVQVREELRWLFASTHLRLASFTGGTPVGGDLRTLQRGVELVIGTPGRLVDLLRRQRLKLADVRVVVLDEADEMLDLGFRQDLETLLQAAPATRRTLLLSATLPAEIRALAQRYQRDAVAIDPRKGAGAGAGAGPRAHEDITHRAHLIAGGDRLAAVVNVLRAGEAARAIVFCTTREGVAEMHAALTARGFAATAISGERAQAERDRALDQLRRGEARVLVATNVAARGLHLPDVDLIVHADLPLNADSLIHRSGRTGRAGRKGTAVVIATVAERRKAERLLDAAHVKVDWTAPPSGDAIAAAARARLADALAAGDEPPPAALQAADDLLARVEAKLPARQLLQRLLARELDRLPVGESLRAIPMPAAGAGAHPGRTEGQGPPARRRTHNEFARRCRVPHQPGRQRPGRSALAAAAHLPPRRRHPPGGGGDPGRSARDAIRDCRRRGPRLRAGRRRAGSTRSPRRHRARPGPGRRTPAAAPSRARPRSPARTGARGGRPSPAPAPPAAPACARTTQAARTRPRSTENARFVRGRRARQTARSSALTSASASGLGREAPQASRIALTRAGTKAVALASRLATPAARDLPDSCRDAPRAHPRIQLPTSPRRHPRIHRRRPPNPNIRGIKLDAAARRNIRRIKWGAAAATRRDALRPSADRPRVANRRAPSTLPGAPLPAARR